MEAKEAQKKYYEKNRDKICKKTKEYSKRKRLEAKEEKILVEEVIDSILVKPPKPPSKKSKKVLPLSLEIKTGKFIFDLEW